MPKNCIVDSGALVEEHHTWAREALSRQPLPWLTCESVFSEALFLLHSPHAHALNQLLRGGHVRVAFDLPDQLVHVLDFLAKYADVPISLAEACLLRMTETLRDPLLVTTDSDFKV